jgi:hypothetical protein
MIPALLLAGLLLVRPAPAAPAQVESPDGRPAVEMNEEIWARRADACRAQLAQYKAKPTAGLVDSLCACTSNPDLRLRALILDKLLDRRIWDVPDFKKTAYPRLRQVAAQFSHDPDYEVQKFADDLNMWLNNWDRDLDPSPLAVICRVNYEHWVGVGCIIFLVVVYPIAVIQRLYDRR